MKKKQINSNLTHIRCSGLNLVKLVNTCTENDIMLNNIVRNDIKTVDFSLDDNDFKKFKKLNLQAYDIKIVSQGGIKKFLNIVYMRMGLIIGFLISFILLFFIQNRLFNIEVIGLTNVTKEQIEASLKDYGIDKFDIMNFNSSEVESYLASEFDFSFVSIITKGNSLIINIKEENSELGNNFLEITAPYNMIIKKINVYAGTSRVSVGDIVYEGQVLVDAYETKDDVKIDVEPCAEIEGETFFSEKYEFISEEKKLERTGKSKILASQTYLGKIKLFSSDSAVQFDEYEIEETQSMVSNYFLPINIKKTIAYELVEVTNTRNFDEVKDNIVEETKQKAYNKVPQNLNVDSEEIQISSTKYGNIVTVYLKSSVYLKYNMN